MVGVDSGPDRPGSWRMFMSRLGKRSRGARSQAFQIN
jgi:hypothetical protein